MCEQLITEAQGSQQLSAYVLQRMMSLSEQLVTSMSEQLTTYHFSLPYINRWF